MPLSRDAIEELRKIHQEDTGEALTYDETLAMGERLLRLYDVLIRGEAARGDGPGSSRVRFDASEKDS